MFKFKPIFILLATISITSYISSAEISDKEKNSETNEDKKDSGMFSVPADYTTEHAYVKSGEYLPQAGISDAELLKGATPQQIADFKLAKEIQTVEQAGAGTAREMAKITSEEADAAVAQARRTGLSTYAKK